MKTFLSTVGLLACLVATGAGTLPSFPDGKFTFDTAENGLVLKNNAGVQVLRYQLAKPADSKLSVESACYFHPFTTPSGVVVTDVAPADHPHHRGIFFGWVEMHGKKDADFWGWGEHAPKDKRLVVNRKIADGSLTPTAARFVAHNEWMADNEPLVKETLVASLRSTQAANVLELAYTLTADTDTTLTRWAFGGFCVRAPKEGELTVSSAEGAVTAPNPSHLKPESDWPASAWYDFTLRLPGGKVAGVTVVNDSKNPPTLWHNQRDIRMINPCIVAPQAVTLKAGQPLTLRYRVVAHDGPPSQDLLARLTRDWSKE
ncbi:MAG TPA: DUF6807 family protein [Verrucomicrobiae bacterium]|nr:DUF6807 family protein [Verrucomicrobiae bacterium]